MHITFKYDIVFCRLINKQKSDHESAEFLATDESDHSNFLRYVLIDLDHLAFVFNGGTFPALSIHPIDTNICMKHLLHNI